MYILMVAMEEHDTESLIVNNCTAQCTGGIILMFNF